jgi:hypothetical protein
MDGSIITNRSIIMYGAVVSGKNQVEYSNVSIQGELINEKDGRPYKFIYKSMKGVN